MKINAFVLATVALASVPAGIAIYTTGAMVGGCAHPGQSVLHAGQCLLDDGVFSDVLDALKKPDYLSQVAGLAVKDAGDLIDCALQAIAGTPGSGSGSGSSLPAAEQLTARSLSAPQPDTDTLASRARVVLATRHPAK